MYKCACQYWHAICLYKFYSLSYLQTSSFYISYLRSRSSIWGLARKFHNKLHCFTASSSFVHTGELTITLFVQAFPLIFLKTAFTSNVKIWSPSFSKIYLYYGSSYMKSYKSRNTVMIQGTISVHTAYSNILRFYQLAYATGASYTYICSNSTYNCFTKNLWQIQGPTFLSGW